MPFARKTLRPGWEESEFGILVTNFSRVSTVAELANRLIDLLQRPYLIDGHVVNVGTSIGIALAPVDGDTSTHLLRSADLALYHSKRSGRGVANFFHLSMEERAQERKSAGA